MRRIRLLFWATLAALAAAHHLNLPVVGTPIGVWAVVGVTAVGFGITERLLAWRARDRELTAMWRADMRANMRGR